MHSVIDSEAAQVRNAGGLWAAETICKLKDFAADTIHGKLLSLMLFMTQNYLAAPERLTLTEAEKVQFVMWLVFLFTVPCVSLTSSCHSLDNCCGYDGEPP